MRNKLVVFGLIVLLVLQTLSPAFAYAQGTTESTTNSTEQKETVASSTKPSAATSAPSSSSINEDKTAEKSSSTDSVEASKATVTILFYKQELSNRRYLHNTASCTGSDC